MLGPLRVYARIGVALLAIGLAPGVSADETGITSELESTLKALSSAPRGDPSAYREAVQSLSSDSRAHGTDTLTLSDRKLHRAQEIEASPWPCVVRLEKTMRGLDGKQVLHLVSFLGLHEVRLATIAVRPAEKGPLVCVEVKGSQHLALEVENTGTERDPRLAEKSWTPAMGVCFDSKDVADRAAKALKRAAELCSATTD